MTYLLSNGIRKVPGIKPRLRRNGQEWECRGGGYSTSAHSASIAYWCWQSRIEDMRFEEQRAKVNLAMTSIGQFGYIPLGWYS